MSRLSNKATYLRYLLDRLEELLERYLLRRCILQENDFEDRVFFLYADEFERIQGQRYLFRDVYRQRPYAEFELILHRDNEGTPWINDLEFLSQYRMKRTDFDL